MLEEFEWDEAKNVRNIEKHGVSFELAARIFEGPILEAPDDRRDYGEDRLIALDAVEGRVLAIVYTWRDERRRIISARKGNKDEREAYWQSVQGHSTPDTG